MQQIPKQFVTLVMPPGHVLSAKEAEALRKGPDQLAQTFTKAVVLQDFNVKVFFLQDPDSIKRAQIQKELLAFLASGKSRGGFPLGELKSPGLVEMERTSGYNVSEKSKTFITFDRSITFSTGGKEIKLPSWEGGQTDWPEVPPDERVRLPIPNGAIPPQKKAPKPIFEDPSQGFKVFVSGNVANNRHPRIFQWAFRLIDEYIQKETLELEKDFLAASKALPTLSDPLNLFGKRLKDFDDKTMNQYLNTLAPDFKKYGFNSESEAISFMREAQIVGVSDRIGAVWRVFDPNERKGEKGYVGQDLGGFSYRK